jgi:hypothetical protein
MKLKRALATGAAVVITGFSLTACGDDDGGNDGGGGGGGDAGDAGDSPDNASTEDFCAVWNDDSIGGGADASPDEQADAAHEAADALAEVGTPEGMDESARNGFEVFVEFLSEVDGDDIEKFSNANPSDPDAFADTLGIDKGEAEDVIAFITYSAQECVPSMDDLPTDGLPTDEPTE